VAFNVNLILLEKLLFSIRVLVFLRDCVCWIFIKSCVCLVQKESLHLFSVVDVFMTVMLPLSAGSTIIFVSLFRSWRACRSCLVMFDDGGLALRRITAICIRMLSA